MPTLWGHNYTRDELMARVGDVAQIGGVRTYRIDGGSGDGMPVVDVTTGSGLRFTVVPGRALDISAAWFGDIPLAYRSPVGEVQGARYEPHAHGWLQTAVLGLLVTGGLDNVGEPGEEDGVHHGLHGRLSNLAATGVSADGEWRGDEYEMWVEGRVRQATLLGENLELRRRISTSLGATSLSIHDHVTNHGRRPEVMSILYHFNPGYPILDEGSQLHARSRSRRPTDDNAAAHESEWSVYREPVEDWVHQVYIHDLEAADDGRVEVALVNRGFRDGIGLGLSYDKRQLPFLNQWKNTTAGEYVAGVEPGNTTVLGRVQNRADRALQTLKPGETASFDLTVSVLASADAINQFLGRIGE